MLVAAAVCPAAPVLVPPLGRGLGADLDGMRAHCAEAATGLWQSGPDLVFVVGGASTPTATSFAPWGADVAVDVPEPLPLALLVGGWLTSGRVRSFAVVDDGLDPGECADLGAELAAAADRVALLVIGDGSARHDEKAPGYLDPRAAPYDERVSAMFAAADLDGLVSLDPEVARGLLVAGRAAWQVLAGAARGRPGPDASATLAAPYGVGYHLVTWRWQEPA